MAESNFDILRQITGGGREAADWLSALKAAQLKSAAASASATSNQIQGAGAAFRGPGTPTDDAFQMFMKAIAQQESGGNYGALGSYVGGDRAYGKYQIMGNNVPNWTKSALGTSMTPEQFLKDKSAQDATARYHLWNYYKNYGPRKAAMAWNQGVGGMQQGWGKDYAQDVMGRMRNYGYSSGMQKNPQSAGYGSGGGWVSPIAGQNPTSNYGWRINPVTGKRSFHEGIDWSAGAGSRVGAAHGGKIIESGWDPIYGNRVIMRTPKGKELLYGHLKQINDRWNVGDTLNPGQRIGQVGSTGWSTGPHLHFGVYGREGQALNPSKFINRMGQPGKPNGPSGHSTGSNFDYAKSMIKNPNGKFLAILNDLGL
jgi:murein DD-endopeptidase MepM/ murein hydrolase activator NlpD